jgi:AbrB family looped-hinge helix DNA binding protein
MVRTKAKEGISLKDDIRENIRFKKKSQVTIPKDIVQVLGLEEGDTLDCRLEDGKIVLVPTIAVPKDQTWFWTEKWQEGEREAEEDIRAGRVSESFDDVDELLDSLKGDDDEG